MATVTERFAKPELIGYDVYLTETEANVLGSILSRVRLGTGDGANEAANILSALERIGAPSDFKIGFADYNERTRKWINFVDTEGTAIIVLADEDEAQSPVEVEDNYSATAERESFRW